MYNATFCVKGRTKAGGHRSLYGNEPVCAHWEEAAVGHTRTAVNLGWGGGVWSRSESEAFIRHLLMLFDF